MLFEVRSDILDRDRNLIGDKVSPSSIFDKLCLEVVNDRKVGSMNFLGSNPKNILLIEVSIDDIFNKLSVSGEFNRRVLVELIEKIFSFFHRLIFEENKNDGFNSLSIKIDSFSDKF